MWEQWVLDATTVRDGLFCFCPVEGDITGDYSIVFGMNVLSDKPPGILVAIIHADGQEAVEAFCEKYAEEIVFPISQEELDSLRSVKIGTLSLKLLRVRCWFTGHEIVYGERWTDEPNYYPKCFIDRPSETITLPTLLNRGYCWLVEREWKWFNQLDEWLFNHAPIRWWPSWWEY